MSSRDQSHGRKMQGRSALSCIWPMGSGYGIRFFMGKKGLSQQRAMTRRKQALSYYISIYNGYIDTYIWMFIWPNWLKFPETDP